MKKQILVLPLMAGMSLMFTGCSFSVNLPFGSPKTAADVIEKHIAAVGEEANYHADMDMDFGITAKGEGITMELPIEIGLSMDVLNGNMHGNMDMSMSFMGQDMKQSAEVYIEAGKHKTTTYAYDSENGYWTVSEDENSAEMAAGFSEIDPDAFKNATLEIDKRDNSYIITQKFADFADASDLYDKLSDVYGSMAESMSVDPDDLLDQWEDAEVVYVFDKDFYLQSVDINGCEFSDTIKENGVSIDMTATLDLSYEFSDYGKIKESDVEVPDDVADFAVSSVKADVQTDVDFGGYDDDEDYSYPEEETLNNVVSVEEPVAEEPVIERPQAGVPKDDRLGSYNEIALTGDGDSWEQTFGADGWTFDNDDGEYSFMTAVNDKYGAELYVYNRTRYNTTRSDIARQGYYGYDIDCSCASNYPVMTWNGITFGADGNEVEAVYGEPYYKYTGSLYTSYEYRVTDDIDITFYIYPDNGLQRVSVANYNGI